MATMRKGPSLPLSDIADGDSADVRDSLGKKSYFIVDAGLCNNSCKMREGRQIYIQKDDVPRMSACMEWPVVSALSGS